jgi:hypothetical protein
LTSLARIVGPVLLSSALAAPLAAQTARQHWQLALGNYTLATFAQSIGKIVRGQNVGRAVRHAAVEAIAPTGLQHAGMVLVGRDWRLALPAQLLVQKGALLQRRSMLEQPQFAGFWSSWELDYLWFNLRVDRGRVRLPRLNVETVRTTLMVQHPTPARVDWGRSLMTGVPTRLADRLTDGNWGQEAAQLVDLDRTVMDNTSTGPDGGAAVYRHELIHALQSIRSTPLVDVLLHQDATQTRPVAFLRLNSGILSLGRVQTLLGGDDIEHDLRFDEWEADAYSRRSTRPFTLH